MVAMTTQDTENLPPQPTRQGKPRKNMTTRIVTGLVMLPLVLFVTFQGDIPLFLFATLLVVLGALEFYHMEQERHLKSNAVVGIATALVVLWAFHIENSALWQGAFLTGGALTFGIELVRGRNLRASVVRVLTTLGGVVYLAVPAGCLLVIRHLEPFGVNWLYALLFSTWATDTFAYLFGGMFGKTPLAPRLSPKKTVEGAIGGILGGIFLPALVLLQMQSLSPATFLLISIAPFVAIGGDLFESGLKRFFGVKDSYVPGLNIFPGHGGVLDRIDSLLWVTLCYYAYFVLSGKLGF